MSDVRNICEQLIWHKTTRMIIRNRGNEDYAFIVEGKDHSVVFPGYYAVFDLLDPKWEWLRGKEVEHPPYVEILQAQ